MEIGAAHVGYGSNPFAASKPRIRKMHIPIDRITASTKYACPKFDPANRDFRPGRRGEFSCRTTIKYPIPSTVVNAINSTNSPYQAWCPSHGNLEPRVERLPDRLHQGQHQGTETDHHEPMRRPDHAPLQHPGVAQELLHQRPQPRHHRTRPERIGSPQPHMREHLHARPARASRTRPR